MQAINVDYGVIIREARTAKGWSRADLAEVYGRFFHEDSISEETIRMWEDYNKVPKKPKRRQVLAILLDIPLAALGLEPVASLALETANQQISKGINIAEATTRLQQFKHQNHATTARPLLTNILETIHNIHDEVPYASQKKRTQFLELLCDYQQFVAGIYKDACQYDKALYYQNKAYCVAKTLQYSEQIALALWRRGLTYSAQENIQAAISDFLAAQSFQTKPSHLDGAIWSSLGHVQALSATNASEQTRAFHSLDQAERLLDKAKREPDTYFVKFNAEGYLLNRASAWIEATTGNFRSPTHAFDMLAEVPADESRKRRYGYSTYLQARVWLEKGELPMATRLALDTLDVAGQIQSQALINRLNTLYQELRGTRYGNSPELAELSVELARVQNPAFFA